MKRKIIALLIGILLPVLSACGAAPASGSSQGAGSPQASSAALPTADPSGAPDRKSVV